nr:MAG TPA: Protein of unknown function (DUF3789) [Caudoviricetes sp.]
MIKFIIGLVLGTFIGIGIMCILQVAKDGDNNG